MLKKLLVLLAVVTVLGACSSETKSGGPKDALFQLEDLDGNTVNLADYEGKNVYVKFWASWCPICLAGLEEVNALAAEDTDFEVLTIVAPGYNNEKKKDAFVKWYKGVDDVQDLPVLMDEGGNLVKEFEVRGYPTSAFINKKGELVKTQAGQLSNDQIKEMMDQLK
ncbi:redoxin family protein [Sporosarcina jeotgali]|uniref:Redoxin family protein n=1 Tax=Sporosarcina jeotgali TaxID=3020056 RepID=A0ABZ0KRY8_9BACL|nr:redoxin family protein [Sporosarcina sp. B2O-1]WOV82974.1 redoxin family protein [Sporosarcina sp. B2O-1]